MPFEELILFDTSKIVASKEDFAKEVLNGLKQESKAIPSKYAYDDRGAQLYEIQRKTLTYYPFWCEMNIFQQRSLDILSTIGEKKFNLIDLGSGDGVKTQVFLQTALKNGYDVEFIPIDISHKSNQDMVKRLKKDLPNLKCTAITARFEEGVEWVEANRKAKNVYTLIGATFGNDPPTKSRQFCSFLAKNVKKGAMFLFSSSLYKDPQLTLGTYTTKAAVDMLQNVIHRINRELKGNIDLSKLYTVTTFDVFDKCIRGVFVPKIDQEISIYDETIPLKKGEVIGCLISRTPVDSELIQIPNPQQWKYNQTFKDQRGFSGLFCFERI